MPRISGPIVGISFTDTTIYAVEARPASGGNVQVTHVGFLPLPQGALQDDVVREPAKLGAALRQILDESGITARNAVIGLPSRAVITRTILIPPVPQHERRSVVRGEIEHLNVLPQNKGAFDFLPLARPDNAAAARGEPLLFFAAEAHVLEGYREAAQAARLRLVGMEPSDFAAIRVAYPTLASRPLALAISLGTYHTNLVFFRAGQIVYHRRVDAGIQQLTLSETNIGLGDNQSEPLGEPWREKHPERVDGRAEQIAVDIFGTASGRGRPARELLAREVARSLEYFRREHAAPVDDIHTVLLPNHLDLSELPGYVNAALTQEVDGVNAFEHVQTATQLPPRLMQEQGVAYAPALGLALGRLGRSEGVPPLDLAVEDIEIVLARLAPRQFAAALAASAVLLTVSGVGAALVARQHGPLRAHLQNAQRELQFVTQQEQTLLAQRQQQRDLVRHIRSHGVAWTNVLHHLGGAIPPGVGLIAAVQQGASLSLSGEAINAGLVPRVWSGMNASRFFNGANVTSIKPVGPNTAFQMTVVLPVPAARVAAAAATGLLPAPPTP